MQRHRRFDRGLGVELGRIGNLEQHVLHHIGAVGALEAERLALEQHVVEAPIGRGEHRGIAHLAGRADERQAHGAARRVARGPALARAGVRRVAIGAQRLAVDEGLRERVDDALARQAQQVRDHGRGGDLDQDHVIEADLVERILERDHALDLVGLDHRGSTSRMQERLAVARQPVGDREDAAEIVGRMAPFRREPGVVEIEPADHGADVERRLHRIEPVGRARHTRAILDAHSGNERPEQLRAGGIVERLEAAAERVDQAIARGLERERAVDPVVEHVVGDIGEHFVWCGTSAFVMRGHLETHLSLFRRSHQS